jgi:hypothetical protein
MKFTAHRCRCSVSRALLGWSAVLLAVFAPLAVHLYARKSR